MGQVKQNTEMESHEEKLHKMIIASKVNDTKARDPVFPTSLLCMHMHDRQHLSAGKHATLSLPGGLYAHGCGQSAEVACTLYLEAACPGMGTRAHTASATTGAAWDAPAWGIARKKAAHAVQ